MDSPQLVKAKAVKAALEVATGVVDELIESLEGVVEPPPPPPLPEELTFAPAAFPSTKVLSNQGCGWQTYHNNALQLGRPSGVPSRSMYARPVWNDLERSLGTYNPSQLRSWIAMAKQQGQLFCTRAQTWSDNDPGAAAYSSLPGWNVTHYGKKHWQPDLGNSQVRGHVERFVLWLASELDKVGYSDFFDIGYFAPWGEWSETNNTQPRLPWPSLDTCRWLVDLHVGAFKNIPIVVNAFMAGVSGALEYAVSKGCGYRGDSWGDTGANNYNHRYLYQPAMAKFPDLWKTAPVVMETWYTMGDWQAKGGNPQAALDFARANHVSYIHNKFGHVPANLEAPVRDLMAGMGYRIGIRSLTFNRERTQVTATVFNAGRSPCYLKHPYLLLDWEDNGVSLGNLSQFPPGEKTVTVPIVRPHVGATLKVGVHPNPQFYQLDINTPLDAEGRNILGVIQ